jgi:hypothetical protein
LCAQHRLTQHLRDIGERLGCYKIILDCSEKNVPFYERTGFTKKYASKQAFSLSLSLSTTASLAIRPHAVMLVREEPSHLLLTCTQGSTDGVLHSPEESGALSDAALHRPAYSLGWFIALYISHLETNV